MRLIGRWKPYRRGYLIVHRWNVAIYVGDGRWRWLRAIPDSPVARRP